MTRNQSEFPVRSEFQRDETELVGTVVYVYRPGSEFRLTLSSPPCGSSIYKEGMWFRVPSLQTIHSARRHATPSPHLTTLAKSKEGGD